MSEGLSEKMQKELAEKINDAFDVVIKQKNEYYQNNPSKIPTEAEIDSLISSGALTNAAISGGSSLIPGPWGMAAVVPELVLVIRNQISLIYDIGAAYGKKDLMNKELMAAILLYSAGTTVGGLLVVHGGKVMVKRVTLRAFQKIVALLGGKITQQALKSTISKWLPGVGAAAMAAWTNYSTRQIGKKAKEILSSEVVVEDELTDVELIKPLEEESLVDKDGKSIDYYKIVTLISLSKVDGATNEQEAELIGEIIEKTGLDIGAKSELIGLISVEKVNPEGLGLIKTSPGDAVDLMTDLIVLAKVDAKIHITEKLFIKQIGKALDFSEEDVKEMLET